MSHRTNILQHRFQPTHAERIAQACTAADTGDLSGYSDASVNSGLDALLDDMSDTLLIEMKPEPLAVIGQGEYATSIDEDHGGMVGFVAIIVVLAIVGGVLALAFGL